MADATFTPGPWSLSVGALIRVHINGDVICGVHRRGKHTGEHNPGQTEADGRLIAAAPDMYEALRSWKCTGCGGSGVYHQNAAQEARDKDRGRPSDPAFVPGRVTCKVCHGSGQHPTAEAVLRKAEGRS